MQKINILPSLTNGFCSNAAVQDLFLLLLVRSLCGALGMSHPVCGLDKGEFAHEVVREES